MLIHNKLANIVKVCLNNDMHTYATQLNSKQAVRSTMSHGYIAIPTLIFSRDCFTV